MALTHRGTNLTGGDVVYTKYQATGRGPVSGSDYQFVSTKDIDYLVAKGCNTFRLLFSWEAMQPTPNAILPSSLTGNWLTYYNKYKALVDYITTTKGCTCIVDIHGGSDETFAAYYGVKIGATYSGFQVQDLFVNLWSQLAAIFRGNKRVMFGITNEPTNMPTMTWFTCAQAVIYAIRKAGALNKIVMPGNYFTGAASWTSTSIYDTGTTKRSNGYGWDNANGVGKPLVDPAMNTCIQVHMYYDANAGGGADDIPNVDIGVTRLKVVTDWARARGLQVMLGEVALRASNPIASQAWSKTVAYMEANSDVILGWQWWAYGPISWWGGYRFTLCPNATYTTDSAQMDMVESALAAPPSGPTQAEYDAVVAQVNALLSEKITLTAQVTMLTSQTEAQNDLIDSLRTERDNLLSDVDTLRSTNQALVAANATLQMERDGARGERDVLSTKLLALVSEVREAALRAEG